MQRNTNFALSDWLIIPNDTILLSSHSYEKEKSRSDETPEQEKTKLMEEKTRSDLNGD